MKVVRVKSQRSNRDKGDKGSQDNDGFALISTLALLLLLSVIAAGSIMLVRTSYGAVKRTEEAVTHKYLFDAAILVYFEKRSKVRGKKPTILGTHAVKVFDKKMSLTFISEDGLVNINRADANLLSLVFAANEAPPSVADRLAAEIIDWRDPDHLRTPSGAESPEYAARGVHGPANRPFESVGELSLLLDMPPELFTRTHRLFTVSSSGSQPVLAKASPGIKKIFLWARANDWKSKDWPDPNAMRSSTARRREVWPQIYKVHFSYQGKFIIRPITLRLLGPGSDHIYQIAG